jgi:hypothetical protein
MIEGQDRTARADSQIVGLKKQVWFVAIVLIAVIAVLGFFTKGYVDNWKAETVAKYEAEQQATEQQLQPIVEELKRIAEQQDDDFALMPTEDEMTLDIENSIKDTLRPALTHLQEQENITREMMQVLMDEMVTRMSDLMRDQIIENKRMSLRLDALQVEYRETLHEQTVAHGKQLSQRVRDHSTAMAEQLSNANSMLQGVITQHAGAILKRQEAAGKELAQSQISGCQAAKDALLLASELRLLYLAKLKDQNTLKSALSVFGGTLEDVKRITRLGTTQKAQMEAELSERFSALEQGINAICQQE